MRQAAWQPFSLTTVDEGDPKEGEKSDDEAQDRNT